MHAFVRSALRAAHRLRDDFVIYADATGARLAVGARESIVVRGDVLVHECDGRRTEVQTRDPLAVISELARTRKLDLYGYLAFDVAALYFDYPSSPARSIHLVAPREELVFDASTVDGEEDAPLPVANRLTFDVSRGREAYAARLERALAAVKRGDLEKVIVSKHLRVDGSLDVLGTLELSLANAAARRFAFRLGGVRGVGSCPETVLRAEPDGRFYTNPLAGTKPRGKTTEEDAALERELVDDAKEVREHALSVRRAQTEVLDLCAQDTFRIFDYMEVKKYRFTQHLSSRVGGRLREGKTPWDALRATFPGVTCTGVEKAPAIRLLGELEGETRGIYGGAVGMARVDGTLDFGITLRSAFEEDGVLRVSAGAGIVAESNIEHEVLECENKMSTIASVLAAGAVVG
jgi:salicylate synthetase